MVQQGYSNQHNGRSNNYRGRFNNNNGRNYNYRGRQTNGSFQSHQTDDRHHDQTGRNNNYRGRQTNGSLQSHHTNDRHHGQTNGPSQGQPNNESATQSTAKLCFQYVQTNHHINNWTKTIPTTIKANIDNVLKNINPPMADDDYRLQLARAGIKFADEIRSITTEFIKRKLNYVTEQLKKPKDNLNLDSAISIATTYSNRMGRLKRSDRDKYLQGAKNIINANRSSPAVANNNNNHERQANGSLQSPQKNGSLQSHQTNDRSHGHTNGSFQGHPNNNSTTQSTANTTVSATNIEPQPPSTPWNIVVSRKAKRRHRSDDVQHSPSPMMDVEPTPALSLSPVNKHTSPLAPCNKKPKDTNFFITRAGVKVFNGDKNNFSINDLDVDKVIVIGDSNLRNAPAVPEGMEILSLPGGRLNHATKALQGYYSTRKERHLRIAVQFGINHRNDSNYELEYDITEWQNAVAACPAVKEIYPVGITIHSALNDEQSSRIAALNAAMEDYFGNDNYIKPLRHNQFELLNNDSYGIHHTPTTTANIIDSISKRVF